MRFITAPQRLTKKKMKKSRDDDWENHTIPNMHFLIKYEMIILSVSVSVSVSVSISFLQFLV